MALGRNKPKSQVAEKTVGRLRKPEDGPREWEFSHAGTLVLAPWGRESLRREGESFCEHGTPLGDVVKRDETQSR
jgi:hypothetical protein